MDRPAARATTQTLAKNFNRLNKGFTLIEMTVVITILVVFAAVIMPNLSSEQKSRTARQFFPKARNLMLEARSRSIGDGVTRSVRIDESGGRLVVERTDADTGDPVEDRSLALPEGVTSSAFRVEKEESNSSEWAVRFFADGKALGGGITFESNGRAISLIVDATGSITQIDGSLPDTSDETWDAGGYEQRV
jgi:prepilin-type N-terminal cleavage/methylation domain-containing protein